MNGEHNRAISTSIAYVILSHDNGEVYGLKHAHCSAIGLGALALHEASNSVASVASVACSQESLLSLLSPLRPSHPPNPLPSLPSPSPPAPSPTMSYFYSPWHEIVIAFGLVLLALAAPLHFRARNTGTILYICWVFTANLFVLINRIIWHDHVRNIAPIWCDICQSSVFLHWPLPR